MTVSQAVEELLASIEVGGEDEAETLTREPERRREEFRRLTESIAVGVPATTLAPAIREREVEIGRLEARLRAPRPTPRDAASLRKALTQKTREWKRPMVSLFRVQNSRSSRTRWP